MLIQPGQLSTICPPRSLAGSGTIFVAAERTGRRARGIEIDPVMRARLFRPEDNVGYKLAEPVPFADSRDHPAIQLAYITAGSAAHILTHGIPDDFQATMALIDPRVLADSIVPNLEVVDLNQRAAAVNWLVLSTLADKLAATLTRIWKKPITLRK